MLVDRCRIERLWNTHIAWEGMKVDAVLVILEVFIDLVLPKYTAGVRKVDEGEKMSTPGTVRCEHEGPL